MLADAYKSRKDSSAESGLLGSLEMEISKLPLGNGTRTTFHWTRESQSSYQGLKGQLQAMNLFKNSIR